jgi:hypothetical protein
MAVPPGGQNLVGATDDFSEFPGILEKVFGKSDTGMKKLVDHSAKIEKNLKAAREHLLKMTTGGSGVGGQSLGLGGFTRRQYQAIGLGTVAAGGAALAYSMAPNTMAAVTQRMYADSLAGLSGMGAQGLISTANQRVGGGATSAMGPTAAAATLGYQGGYLANTLSSRRIMGQIGGMSAITGASNEQVAGAFAGINAMSFLRAGIRARDRQGNLVRPDQLINQAYRFLYGNRSITKEQAMMVLNPGSKGYATLSQLAGGNADLLQQLQMGVIARASKGSTLNKKDLSDPNTALDLMGVGKESPIRSMFRYNTSEAKKLEATEGGLVGGYNVALRSTSSVNDAFSTMADLLGPVNQGLMTLKGILQTLPGAGNTGATLSGLGGMAMGAGASALQLALTARMLGVGGKAGFLGTGAMAAGGTAATVGAGTAAATGAAATATGAAAVSKRAALLKLLKSSKGKLSIGAIAAALGTQALDGLFGEKVSPGVRKAGLNLANIGGMAATGAAIGSFIPGLGTGIGALIGTGIGLGQTLLGGMGGDSDCGHGHMGCSHGMGGPNDSSPKEAPVFQPPVQPGTRISSDYGPRPGAAKRNPGISSYHRGIDYALPVGSPVLAASDGIVTETGNHNQYGYYVIIKHAVKSSLYGHLSRILVSKGQRVKRGEVIARSGGKKGAPGAGTSTGPHLHFELRAHGGVGAQDRENPKGFFGKAFAFIKNLGSKVLSGLKGMSSRALDSLGIKKIDPVEYDSPISQKYSSPSVSQLLKMLGNGPTNFERMTGGLDRNSKAYKDNFDTEYTEGRGSERGIAGGSREGLMQILYGAGFRGDALKTAFAVALAESGGRASAKSHPSLKKDDSYGLFQINMIGGLGPARRKQYGLASNRELFNPTTNANIAFAISKGGKNWKPWGAYTSGSFTKYLDDAGRVAKDAGIGGGDPSAIMGSSPATETGGAATAVMRGNSSFNASSKIDVTVNMNVQIARASVAEAQRLASDTLKMLENKLRLGEGLGQY